MSVKLKRSSLKDVMYKPLPGLGRKPLRTIREMAEEFGVSLQRLGRELAKDPAAPKLKLNHSSGCRVHSNHWYDPDAMRAWWKSRDIRVP